MKRTLALTVMTVLCFGGAASAELCTIDTVPAATLLLPYFEVDLSKPRFQKAEQTIISLQNAEAAPAIAHVTLWTDLSVPTLAFDVVLTGYDVEEINLTELFYTGAIRRLQTEFPPAVGIPGNGFVLGETPSAGLQTRGELIRAHRGESVGPDGPCYGVFTGDNTARGYVTIDNVAEESVIFPNESGYFGPNGVANDTNALWGVVFVTLNKSIQAENLIHIEAAESVSSGSYTFYGRYTGFDGSDGREPLNSTFGARYFTRKEATDLIVWRDSRADQGPFDCSELGRSGWYPLGQTQIVVFNEVEQPLEPFEVDIAPFPAETQKVRIGGGALDVAPYRSGWIYLNLNQDDDVVQSFVWVRQGLRKRAALYSALSYTSACGDAPSPASPID